MDTQRFRKTTVNRFDVVVVSEEFLALIRELPELSTAPYVEVSGKRIEGPKEVLVATTMEEVERSLPSILRQLSDRQHQHVRVIHRSGLCCECAESKKFCTHLGRTIPSINRVFDLDISKVEV